MRWADARAPRCALVILLLGAGEVAAQARPSRTQRARTAVERAARAREAARARDRYDDTFQKYSKRYFGPNFDWTLFKAQAMAESNLNPNARSYVGARGLMQLMPSTYAEIRTRRPELGAINDPEFNIAAGIYHDRFLWRLWSRDIPEERRLAFMFASYNAGQGTIGRAARMARERQLDPWHWPTIESIAPTVPRWRYRETLGYVRKIDTNHAELRARR